MNFGWARCSLNETKQDISRQIRELKAAGAEQIFSEYVHGDAVVKKNLEALLEAAQDGDSIFVTEVSRLSRSTKQLCDIIDIVKAKHMRLVIIGSMTIDCRNGHMDPMSEAFLQIAGVFSQLEKAMLRERVLSSLANARAKGKNCVRHRNCAAKPAELSTDSVEIEQRFRTN